MREVPKCYRGIDCMGSEVNEVKFQHSDDGIARSKSGVLGKIRS